VLFRSPQNPKTPLITSKFLINESSGLFLLPLFQVGVVDIGAGTEETQEQADGDHHCELGIVEKHEADISQHYVLEVAYRVRKMKMGTCDVKGDR